jgi:RNA 2',3'-cyclic 3'-phosphodiesterase
LTASPTGRRGRPGSPRARLFLALDPSDSDRARLAAWRDSALAGRDDLRPITTEALHLTLVFLGYRPEKEIAEIGRIAHAAIADLPAARLTATAVTPVPKRRPRLFALDLDDEDGRATALQAAASDALAAGRFYTPERRPFWPHLTFARVKRGARAAPLDHDPPPGPLEAARVTLYRSLLSPRGARYEPLAATDLH